MRSTCVPGDVIGRIEWRESDRGLDHRALRVSRAELSLHYYIDNEIWRYCAFYRRPHGLPPRYAPYLSPFDHCQKSRPRRPATRHKRLALLLCTRKLRVSQYSPTRSVAGHLIPGYEGRTCVKSLACYYVLLISLEFVRALRTTPSRSCAFIDIKCCLSRSWISTWIKE